MVQRSTLFQNIQNTLLKYREWDTLQTHVYVRRSSLTYDNRTPRTPFERDLPYLCIIKSQFSHANGDVQLPRVKRPLFCYPATNKVQLRWFSMNIILLGNKYTVTFFICYLNFVLTIFPADGARSWSIDDESWASSAAWQKWH